MQLLFLLISSVFSKSVLEVLKASSSHKTLASLITDLPEVANILQTEKPVTFLAPTDAAFEKLGNSTLSSLKSNPANLAEILKYHVIFKVPFAGSKKSFPITAQGQALGVTVENGVTVSFGSKSAKISGTVPAQNGIFNSADTVLVPPPSFSKTAFEGKFVELTNALNAVNLVQELDNLPQATIFIPTNKAFQTLAKSLADKGIVMTDVLWREILALHVVPSVYYSTDILAGTSPFEINTLSGKSLVVAHEEGKVFLSGSGNDAPAKVLDTDILFDKGSLHLIDAVLLPDIDTVTDNSCADYNCAETTSTEVVATSTEVVATGIEESTVLTDENTGVAETEQASIISGIQSLGCCGSVLTISFLILLAIN